MHISSTLKTVFCSLPRADCVYELSVANVVSDWKNNRQEGLNRLVARKEAHDFTETYGFASVAD